MFGFWGVKGEALSPGITEAFVAKFAHPAGFADARAGLAAAVTAAVNGAGRFGAVLTRPAVGA